MVYTTSQKHALDNIFKAFDALGGKPIPKVVQLSQEYAC